MSAEVFVEPGTAPSDRKPRTTKSPRTDLLGTAFACFIPMVMFLEVQVIGRLFYSEIILLCVLPFLLMDRGRLLLAPLPKTLLSLGLAWLLSQIVTDVIRGTPFEDWIRGWAKIAFLMLNFSAIYLYIEWKEQRLFMFALGIAIGQILGYFFNPNIYIEGFPWKFGVGPATTLIVVLASQIKVIGRVRYLPSTIILVMGLINFFMDARSLGLVCLLTAGFLLIEQLSLSVVKKRKRTKVAVLILLGSGAIYGITALYDYSSSQGWLGDEVQEKYELQSSGDAGVLLGARNEIFASTEAVMDSPIIGHGSWAKDEKYVVIMVDALQQRGYRFEGDIESNLIPTHSYIMGAWVEAGFIGAIFWLWALLLIARTLWATSGANLPLAPLIAYMAFGLLWAIPFSPFGLEGRLYAAYTLSLMIYALTLSRSHIAKRRPT